MANMPDDIESIVVNYLTRGTAPAALTGPMRVQLLSALGAGDAAGTVVTGAIQALGATVSTAGGASSNTAIVRFEGLANPTSVVGYRVIDSNATPVVTLDNIARTGGAVSVVDGIFEIPVGGLSTTGD